MPAKPLVRRSERRDDGGTVHIVVWELTEPLAPCVHRYKYRLAYIVDGACVVRYDNERGKGDHRHLGDLEEPYSFSSIAELIAAFQADVEEWEQ